MPRLIVFQVVLLFCCVSTFAAEPERREVSKQPWQWTLDDRLASRTDPVAARERTRVHVQESGAASAAPGFIIDGKRNPELFLSHELMALLLSTAGTDDAASQRTRASYDSAVEELGWEATTFWRDFADASGEFVHLTQDSAGPERTSALSARICSARVDALITMRRRYARFDEFLYLHVAPRHVVTSEGSGNTEWLRWLERGCR